MKNINELTEFDINIAVGRMLGAFKDYSTDINLCHEFEMKMTYEEYIVFLKMKGKL